MKKPLTKKLEAFSIRGRNKRNIKLSFLTFIHFNSLEEYN